MIQQSWVQGLQKLLVTKNNVGRILASGNQSDSPTAAEAAPDAAARPREPTYGDSTVIYDHYAGIPMADGYILTDAPSLIRTADGALLCSVPLMIGGTPREPVGPLLFFRSEDDGRTWNKLPAESIFCAGTLFRHDQSLYFLGTGPVHRSDSNMQIIRSDDEGQTWSDPVTLFEGPFSNPACAYVKRDGQFCWCCDTRRDMTYGIAGDLSRDLTDPGSWRISDGLPIPPLPPSLTRGRGNARILEGNVVDVNGRLQISWRYMIDMRDTVGIGVILFTKDQIPCPDIRQGQVVDHCFYRDAAGKWQAWVQIRGTKSGRVFTRWEQAGALTDTPWSYRGVHWRGDPEAGESETVIQAPHVYHEDRSYWAFYGGGGQICMARSDDGVHFTRHRDPDGLSRLFADLRDTTPQGIRDPFVVKFGQRYHLYYTSESHVLLRTAADLDQARWSQPRVVAVERNRTQCPFVVRRNGCIEPTTRLRWHPHCTTPLAAGRPGWGSLMPWLREAVPKPVSLSPWPSSPSIVNWRSR